MRFLAAAVFALLSGPAFALSCMPASVADDYQRASDDSAEWIVAKGALRFDRHRLPRVDMSAQADTPPETDIPARFAGHSLGPDGFTRPFVRDVTLRALCFGPWCGSAVNGEVMAFLKREGDDYVIFASPCPTMTYFDPAPALLEEVMDCFNGQDCTPVMER